MNTGQRLTELMDGIHFKIMDGGNSIEELRGIVQNNLEQYAIIEAKGVQFEERLQDLIGLVLAEKFHPMAMNGFGDTSESSLHRVVTELFQAPEVIAGMGKNRQLILTTLRADGFDETQMAVISDMSDSVLRLMIDFIVQLVGRLRIIPIQETSGVTGILAQMMKEGSHAIDTRNN